jgi:tight adherence protein B
MTVDIPHHLSVWALGLVLGLGLTGLAVGLLGHRHPEHAPSLGATGATGVRSMSLDLPAVVVAIAVGASCAIVTGWPVAVVIGGAAAYGLPRLLRQTSGAASVATIEAVATWTEMLQGTLAASAGLGQAIVATAELSPAPIRTGPELSRAPPSSASRTTWGIRVPTVSCAHCSLPSLPGPSAWGTC